MNTRRLPRMRRGRNVTWMFSAKNDKSVFTDSFLEQSYAYLLELSTEVKHYATQPESMKIKVDGRTLSYTPDFLVEDHDGYSYYVEVHHSNFIDQAFLSKMEAVRKFISLNTPSNFIIITEHDLPVEVALNLKLISNDRNAKALPFLEVNALPVELTFGELYSILTPLSSDPSGAIYELLARKAYLFEASQTLNPNSVLRRAN
ncbi:Tn7 transposase TnsA N-terminal domain-containing protein [Shewanella psychrotolerans]|uniref:Tn7 transposase TnsA N-terminal domain-containing protein n=1 Tax=Shewanella psychrotolerans TaxID=2864206 RepID=UPI001C65707C|nr:Tn7 transposase TnsA N-terminal domain-containing protein [Shewanella psychrotolerans]QYJ99759.1 Tn7 transposase TnsA N-terminal domain-containing protein [Shewanella psychrotolerans]